MSTTTTCRNMVGPFLMQARAGASFTPSPGGFPHPAAVTHLLVVALIEDAIDTHRPHVHIVELGPSKKFVVEFKPAFEALDRGHRSCPEGRARTVILITCAKDASVSRRP